MNIVNGNTTTFDVKTGNNPNYLCFENQGKPHQHQPSLMFIPHQLNYSDTTCVDTSGPLYSQTTEIGTPDQHKRPSQKAPTLSEADMDDDELIQHFIKKSKNEAEVMKAKKDAEADIAETSRDSNDHEIDDAVRIFLSTASLKKPKHKTQPPSSSSSSASPPSQSSSHIFTNWAYNKVVEASNSIMIWANNLFSSDDSILQKPQKYFQLVHYRNVVENHPTAFLKDGSAYSFIGHCSSSTASDLQNQSGRHVRQTSTHRTFTQHFDSQEGTDQSSPLFLDALAKVSEELDISPTSAHLMNWHVNDEENDLQPEFGTSYQNMRGEWHRISSSTSRSKTHIWERNVNGIWERHLKPVPINRKVATPASITPPPGFCVNQDGKWTCSPPINHRFQGTEPFSTVPLSETMSANSASIQPHEAIADTGANGHVFHNFIKLMNPFSTSRIVHTAGGENKNINTSGDFEVAAVNSKGDAIEPLQIKNINQLPSCPINLISISMLCKEGLSFHFLPEHAQYIESW
mmetsp:Transcript_23744/g.27900  ORF Transcript_23744/g.27900 Transcript_23744/m.27900 type:complete len:517 (-) Transcript_23744:3007-4557(-)